MRGRDRERQRVRVAEPYSLPPTGPTNAQQQSAGVEAFHYMIFSLFSPDPLPLLSDCHCQEGARIVYNRIHFHGRLLDKRGDNAAHSMSDELLIVHI